LWQDLCKAKANISFGQLIQIAPSLKKEMKEGATNHRKPKNMSIATKVAPENNDPNLNERKENDVFGYGLVEIKVEVMDKIIPHVIVDDVSNVNITTTNLPFCNCLMQLVFNCNRHMQLKISPVA
jgi:hypothetical protein